MRKILRCKRGESYIDTVISFLVIIMVVVFALNVYSFLTLKSDMDYFAQEMVKAATVAGRTDSSSIQDRLDELSEELGFVPKVGWEGTDFIKGTQKVQYGHTIRVTIEYESELVGMGVLNVPITLQATYSGLSQKYQK